MGQFHDLLKFAELGADCDHACDAGVSRPRHHIIAIIVKFMKIKMAMTVHNHR
jgi:hypothetical protein